ncbi:MAG: macro domain-containing protein [Acidobacteria bacterium]|nr:macro domain-containing protein [Acidobacteriota bacterium]
MIQEVSGDILYTSAQVIAHGVAPNDHFNVGLALSLREYWPKMYQDFRHYCHIRNPKPGGVWVWAGSNGKIIASLLTRDAPMGIHASPGKATLHNINYALKELRKVAQSQKYTSIALPRLACGMGGLMWEDVYPLITKHLEDLGIPVFVYSNYSKRVRAVEKFK